MSLVPYSILSDCHGVLWCYGSQLITVNTS